MSVRSEPHHHVTLIQIDRPHVRNAVDGPTARALLQAFEAFAADDWARVAVLAGVGDTFCAGADLKAMAAGNDTNPIHERDADTIVNSMGPMGPTRLDLDKPVIAAIEGYAVAGGLELALWADLRVAAANASLGVFCRRWGVPLVDGGTVRLPRLVGQSHALDLILTGREVGADEAHRMGLVNRVVEPGTAVKAALDLATELSKLPQRCLRSDRRSAIDQWSLSSGEALARETRLGLATVRSGETRDGATHFSDGAGRHGEAAAWAD